MKTPAQAQPGVAAGNRKPLTEIAVGDRVWVSNGSGRRGDLKAVVRLTPKQIILEGLPEYNRYHRGRKLRYGDSPTYYFIGQARGRIIEIATPDECAEWDAVRAAEAEARNERRLERERLESARLEMAALFDGRVRVGRDDQSGWVVELSGLNDSELRQLASLWAERQGK